MNNSDTRIILAAIIVSSLSTKYSLDQINEVRRHLQFASLIEHLTATHPTD